MTRHDDEVVAYGEPLRTLGDAANQPASRPGAAPTPDALAVTLEADDQVVHVAVTGEIDLATVEVLHRELRPALALNLPMCLDMSGVSFMDSTGIAALVKVHNETIIAAAAPLTIVNASAAVRRVLELTGVDQIVNIEG